LQILPARPRRDVRLLGTGAALPAEVLASLEIDARLGLKPGTVERRTGVRERRVERTRSAAALGAEAARDALADAGLAAGDVDLLIAASGTPDQAMPCNAALLHHELGLPPIPAFDVGASCLSFLAALDTAATLVACGHHRRVLIVSADIASCGLDWSHVEWSGIFGDGAAAVVLGPAEGTGSALLASAFATHGEGAHLCEIPAGGSRHHPARVGDAFFPLALFRMDGRAVFRMAADNLPALVDGVLASAGVSLDGVAVVVPHQASRHGIDWLRRRLKVPRGRVSDIFADHGNQVGASLPTALHAAIRSGQLRRGQLALLVGTGAGVSLGGALLCY
jgi:3-oxoacyl-[acyl-carrier-protein] synthase-3